MRFTRIILIVLASFIYLPGWNQSSANYTSYTYIGSSLTADRNGNPINLNSATNLVPNNTYWVNSGLQEIGFDFMFMGKLYTHFIAGSNGQMALAVENSPSYVLQTDAPNQLRKSVSYPPLSINSAPIIAPFWDILLTARSGATIRKGLSGTYPYRCLVVEWNAVINYTSTTSVSDGVFQARLYEGSGDIEFVYGKMNIGASSQVVTSSIGFAAGPATNQFIAVKNLSTFAVTRNSTEEEATRTLVNSSTPGEITGLHSSTEGSRRTIVFRPDSINDNFDSYGITNITATGMQLNWSDNFQHKLGYLIYKAEAWSNDYELEADLPATATHYIATGLEPYTTYHWKIKPYTVGFTNKQLVMFDSTGCSMENTYTIGPSGNFNTIQAAIDSLEIWGVRSPVTWELQQDYSFNNETLPIRFSQNYPCSGSTNPITIQPAAGASFHFVNNSSQPVFLLDSTSHIIIDGRAAGTGTPAMSFEGSGEIIRIRNGRNNSIQYITFKSDNNTEGISPVIIESTMDSGSVENYITHCEFYDRGSSFNLPLVMINGKSNGLTWNKSNKITYNRFYNFRRYAIIADGEGWTINNNSFYATQAITATDSSGFIRLSQADNILPNFIQENYFGGSDATATGTSMQWNVPASFSGIEVSGSTQIMYNIFKRINISAMPLPGPTPFQLHMIMAGKNGSFNTNTTYFNISDNQFGDSTLADSIQFSGNNTYQLDASLISNIGAGATEAIISVNRMVNIRTSATSTDLDLTLIFGAYNSTISNNIISSNVHSARIIHRGTGQLVGIHTNGMATIKNNLLTNMAANQKLVGILNANNDGLVSNNTISYLKSLRGIENDYFSVAGVANLSSSGTIEKNRIFHLEDSSTAQSSGMASIFSNYSYAAIRKNLIDGLIVNPQTGFTSSLVAIETEDDHSSIENNMIRLGVDSAGNTVMKGLFLGFSNNYTSGHVLKHNTIYITGQNASPDGLVGSQCAVWFSGTTFMNNIFVNYRTISGTDLGNNIYLADNTLYPHTMDNNIYHQPPGARFTSGAIDFDTWVANPNHDHDQHSIFMAPGFINPEGPTRTLDLHLSYQTIAEGNGNPAYTTINDFDDQVRDAYTPVDIGADAGNFTAIDIAPPNIYVTPLADSYDTASRYITVKITDSLSGIRLTGNTMPAIWYRKSYPATSAWQFGHGELESGNGISGHWKFYINHQAIGITDQGTDSVQYYFVAQDSTNSNISTNPAGGNHTSVSQQVDPPPTLYSYRVNNTGYIVPDIVDIGEGQHYTSLTNDGGLFEGLGKDSVSNNSTITIRISSYLFETGKWGLDSVITAKNVKLKITPAFDSTFMIRNISDLNKPMIRLYNADKVTIDGSYNNNGRWLRFINTHSNPDSTQPVIACYNGVDSLTISNSEWQYNRSVFFPTLGMMSFENGQHKDIILSNNFFSSIEGAAYAAYAITSSNNGNPTRLTAISNHFVNLYHGGMYFNPAEQLKIDSNHFYWNDTQPHNSTTYNAIRFHSFTTTHEIKNNFIGGSGPGASGGPWINSAAYTDFYGMQVLVQSHDPSFISNNTIKNFRMTNPDAEGFNGILAYGKFFVHNNTIGDSTVQNSIELSAGGSMLELTGNYRIVASQNLIAGIKGINTDNVWANIVGIWSHADSATIKNNIIRDLQLASPTTGLDAMGVTGIYMGTNGADNIIKGNHIFNLSGTHSGMFNIAGIQTISANNGSGIISSNRIYNLHMPNSTNGVITGIYFKQNGLFSADNNQISLVNGNSGNSIKIYGMRDQSTHNTGNVKSMVYNTIYIGGSQSSGFSHSYGYLAEGIGITGDFRNNIVINKRNGGFGHHGAIAIKTNSESSSWAPGTADYNFYVLNDTARMFLWGMDTLSLTGWRNLTATDINSFGTLSGQIDPQDFFMDLPEGNLNINTGEATSWYVNGKGIPMNGFIADFDDDLIRSSEVSTGSTDIGSDEFNTSTVPPGLIVFGNHQPGGSDTLYFENEIVAVINWASQGTLPTINSAQLYTGTWPNDPNNNNTIANARTMNAYLAIEATGGSNYVYDLIMYYDSSMLGTITDASTMVVNKKQTGVPGTWAVHPTVVTPNTLTVAGLNSFSEFTATDAAATLAAGLPSPDLSITDVGLSSISIATASTFHAIFNELNTGIAAANNHKVLFYLSPDNILTAGSNGDLLLDDLDIISVAAGGSTGVTNHQLTMPCTVTAGGYFLFIVADGEAEVNETNETNNEASVSITVTIGSTIPGIPVITSTPSATVCAPSEVTLTAASANCSTCTYSWSNGETGPGITVNTGGIYTVTVSNSCGVASASQEVIIHPQPDVIVTAITTSICEGSSTQLTAAGAGSYTWSPATGLSGTTGSTVTASPMVTTTYTVTGTTGECSKQQSITITVNEIPGTPVITQSGNSLQSSASNGNQWYKDGTLINGATASSYTPVAAGTYTVKVTLNGCSSNFSTGFPFIPTAINSPQLENRITMGPNPVENILFIKHQGVGSELHLALMDMQGREIFNARFSSSISVDMRKYNSGSYIVRIVNRRNGESTQRIILKK